MVNCNECGDEIQGVDYHTTSGVLCADCFQNRTGPGSPEAGGCIAPMVDTVDPNDFEISAGEKYRNKEIRRLHRQAAGEFPNFLSGTIDVLEAWDDGKLSEGQATQALCTDRLSARTLKEIYEREKRESAG